MKYVFIALAVLLVLAPPAQGQINLTAAQIINGVPQTTNLSGASDLTSEITDIANTILADGKHYPAGAYLVGQYASILSTSGRNLVAMAQLLEFLPPQLKSPFSAYLKVDATRLLDNSTYVMEETGSLGYRTGPNQYNVYGPLVIRSAADAFDERYTGSDYRDPYRNVLTQLPGNISSGLRLGAYMGAYSSSGHTISRWEGLYGLWAYAHYTGDWAFVQSNWTTIKNLRNQAPDNPMKNDYPYQGGFLAVDGSNSWIAGLIGYARMASHLGDTATLNATITSLNPVLAHRDSIATEGTIITYGWDDQIYHASTDWRGVRQWWELTPEIGRKFLAADTSADLFSSTSDRYYPLADNAHEGTGENQGEHPWVSHQAFQGQLYSMAKTEANGSFTYTQTKRDFLRAKLPITISTRAMPWHMDTYRMQNLVSLVRAHGTTIWVNP